jgi:hypothetical protein
MNDYIKQIQEPTIKLEPIEIESTGNNSDDKLITSGLGFTPFLWYSGYQIQENNISYLKLYHNGMLPEVNIIFMDEYDIIEDEGFPENDTPFEIFLNSGSDHIKSIHIRFKIKSFKKVSKEEKKYNMTGIIDLTDLYISFYRAFRNKTSFETLKDICTQLGLGFNSNITDTKDSMTWIQRSITLDFMRDIIRRSYISDDSFMIGYIDFYYCFNYIDIEKEMRRNISNDTNIDSANINSLNNDNVEEQTRLELSTDDGLSSSNLYIESYKVLNKTMTNAIDNGFFVRTRYYDTLNKTQLTFNVDSLTDKDDGKLIIPKGKQNDKEYYDKNFSNNYMGKIDIDNVHKNYSYSKIQNEINLKNIEGLSMDIFLPNLNWSIYRFQKVRVNIIPKSPSPTKNEVIWKLSGEWLISGIDYTWKNNKMSQEVNILRRSLGKNPDEKLLINNI